MGASAWEEARHMALGEGKPEPRDLGGLQGSAHHVFLGPQALMGKQPPLGVWLGEGQHGWRDQPPMRISLLVATL